MQQVNTGYRQSKQTSASGEYVFLGLPVGEYQITVTMTGFKSYVQKGIVRAVGQTVTVPIHLETGSLVQQVTVTANACW